MKFKEGSDAVICAGREGKNEQQREGTHTGHKSALRESREHSEHATVRRTALPVVPAAQALNLT